LVGDLVAGCRPRYRFGLPEGGEEIDPRPVVAAVARDVLSGIEPAVIAAGFHLAVAELVSELAEDLRARTGIGTVALSGGVFLNVVLTRLCAERLSAAGFRVLRHHLVPPSDAGLALGQIVIAARLAAGGGETERAEAMTEQGRTACA
jgi:hydrogenase maturation protein HypF